MKVACMMSPVVLILLSSVVHAGAHVGNGGDAIVCYGDSGRRQIVSIELFDYWEGENTAGNPGKIRLGDSWLSVSEKIEIAVGRVAEFDPVFAEKIGRTARAMAENIESYLVTGNELPEIDDTNPRALPRSPCFIEQFAVQWKDPGSGKRRFAISRKFYESPLLANDSRAGILLHEAIYRQAILAGQSNSDGTRNFNYFVSTSFLDGASLEKYVQVLQSSGLGTNECRIHKLSQLGVTLYGTYLDDYRNIRTYSPCLPVVIETPTVRLRGLSNASITGPVDPNHSESGWGFHADRSEISMLSDQGWVTAHATWTKASFSTEGKLLRISTSWFDHREGELPIVIRIPGGPTLPCRNQPGFVALFNSKGQIRSCRLRNPVTEFLYQGQLLQLSSSGHRNQVEFDEQYRLRTAWLAEPATFMVAGTRIKLRFKEGSVMKLDEQGRVLHGALVTPYPLIVNGIDTTIDWIHVEDASAGTVFVSARHVLNPTFQGKRILFSDRYSEAWNHLCHRLGYTRGTKGYPAKFRTVFVGAPEQFYDPESSTFVSKVDEDVSIVDQGLHCEGYFDVPLR